MTSEALQTLLDAVDSISRRLVSIDEPESPSEETQLTRLEHQPSCISNGTMRGYQIEALNWMIGLHDIGVAGILADEMGLGKTLETISLLGYLQEYREDCGPFLVVVPLSTLGNWIREFSKWCPTLTTLKFHGDKEDRKLLRQQIFEIDWNVCLTSYEIAIKEASTLKKFQWKYMIVDEAHRMKNEKSLFSQTSRAFSSQHRLLITGTPLQNNLRELWALLNFLIPDLFYTFESFEDIFSGESGTSAESVMILHRILRPFILRRLKQEVETELKPKIEVNLYIGMSELQKEYYKDILMNNVKILNGQDMKKKTLHNTIIQLRKASNHPYLFPGAEPGPPYIEGEHLVEASGKMILLDKLLIRLKEQESRVLIFSQMTKVLDIIEDFCELRRYHFCRLDGNTEQLDREQQMEDFNKPGSEKFLFLLSTRAGGLGVNLHTADSVILFDSDWNPQMDLQAQDRAHRIGQKKQVFVYRFVTEGTVEEKIVERAQRKLFLDALVIQQGRKVFGKKPKASSDELLSIVRFGAEEMFRVTTSNLEENLVRISLMSLSLWDVILEKGRQKTQEQECEINKGVKNISFDELKFDGAYETTKMYEFEGSNFKEMKKLNIPEKKKPILEKRRAIKVDYTERLYPGTVSVSGEKRKRRKLPKFVPTKCGDWQFYKDPKRLLELEEREFYSELKKNDALPKEWRDEIIIQCEYLNLESIFTPLTDQEKAELNAMRENSFSDWKKGDMRNYLYGVEIEGKDPKKVAKYVAGKTIKDVQEYHKAFWEKFQSVKGWEKFVARIDKAASRRKKSQTISKLIEKKLKGCTGNPYTELKFRYWKSSSTFSTDADRFMFLKMHEIGYGNWSEMKLAVRNSPLFCFDWYMKSRKSSELRMRCDTLIGFVKREFESKKGVDSKTSNKIKATSAGGKPKGRERKRSRDTGASQEPVKRARQ